MVIDDLADRVHDCDLLLDQTYGRTEDDYRSLVPGHCTRLTGSKYALLRPEFAELREYSLQRRKNTGLNRILITMGGIDKDNSTGKVLAVLKQCELSNNLCTTVVMGQNSPWLSSVKEVAAEMPWATEVLVNVKDMARQMADSDLCIGAAGSTVWECCCLGLPTLLFVLADNQRLVARNLQDAGAVRLLGAVSDIDEKFNSAMVDMKNREILTEMSHLASMITNGQGAEQVVQHMECIQ
jgi:UDP-2,4-diacetamido-2,4,6-trideoxy-beta-L-altropyranose hydrolase